MADATLWGLEAKTLEAETYPMPTISQMDALRDMTELAETIISPTADVRESIANARTILADWFGEPDEGDDPTG